MFTCRSVSTTSTSDKIALNAKRMKLDVMIGVAIVSGSPTYKVEGTMDDAEKAGARSDGTASWFTLEEFPSLTAAQTRMIALPYTALRVSIISGSGTVKMLVNEVQS